MSDLPAETENPEVPAGPHGSRIAFESLRERTDELELIISGLTVFALLALPSWMFDLWLQGSAHAAGATWSMQLFLYQFASGLSYTIAGAFMLHLAIRAYWIGLIGVKATFPAGIRWDRISTLGPLSREYYQKRIPDLGSAIDSVDRVASMVFALASLVMLTIVWAVLFFAATYLLSLLVAWLLNLDDRSTVILALSLYSIIVSLTMVVWLLDTRLLPRHPKLQHSRRFRALVLGTLKAVGLVYPQRLVLPVQLALQSNTSNRIFMVGLFLVMMSASIVGLGHVLNARFFTLFGDYAWLDEDAVDAGFSGAHYENLRSEHDRILRVPMIPADVVSGSYLRLFLPYLPYRDNPLLDERCGNPGTPPPAAEATPGDETAVAETAVAPAGVEPAVAESPGAALHSPRDCLASIWTVSLDGQRVAVESFLSSERRDLGLRGLQGYLALEGLAAGQHDIEVHWNRDGPEEGEQRRRRYRIPFWLAPDFETGMQ